LGKRFRKALSIMKVGLLLPTLCSFASAAPRISQISPVDGISELLISDGRSDALGNLTVDRFRYWTFDPEAPRDRTKDTSTTLPAFSLPFHQTLTDFNGDGELEYVAHDQFVTPTTRGPLMRPVYHFKGDHLSSSYYNRHHAVAVVELKKDGEIDALYADGFSGLHLVRNNARNYFRIPATHDPRR